MSQDYENDEFDIDLSEGVQDTATDAQSSDHYARAGGRLDYEDREFDPTLDFDDVEGELNF